MTDLPRLAVTREQAHSLMEWRHPDAQHTLHLPERPTMPCPVGLRLRGGGIGGQMMTECPTCGAVMPSTAGPHPRGVAVPIPEGTRVEVGWWDEGEDWWEQVEDGHGLVDEVFHPATREWHPVATATVAEVTKRITFDMDDDVLGEWTWLVTLTDVEATDG